jgi:Patatin-like phospholipase
LLALPLMGELQATLRGMHRPAESSYDAGDPSNFGFQRPSRGHAQAVLNTWEAARVDAGELGVSSPQYVFRAFFLIDALVFAPMYCAALALGLLMLRRRLPAVGDQPPPGESDKSKVSRLLNEGRNRLVCGAVTLVPALFVFDELENISALVLSWEMGSHVETSDLSLVLIGALWTTSWLKWLLVALILAPALIAIGSFLREWFKSDRSNGIWDTLMAIRVNLVLLVFFGVIVLLTEQGVDVLRAWNGAWWQAAAGVGFTLLFAFVATASADHLLRTTPVTGKTISPWAVILLGLALVAAGLALDLWLWHERAEGMWALGLIIAVIGLLSVPIAHVEPRVESAPAVGKDVLPAALGVVPLGLLGLAILSASTSEVFYYRDHGGPLVLMIIGILVAGLLTWAFYFTVRRGTRVAVQKPPFAIAPVVSLAVVVAGAVVGLGLTLAVWIEPWDTGFALGTVAILSGWMTAALLLWTALVRGLGKIATPPVMTIVGFIRIPILTLIVLWALLGASVDDGGYHNVRVRQSTAPARLTLEQIFNRWLRDQGLEAPSPTAPITHSDDGRKAGIPLVFVSASGGGVRAAFWTAIALDCLLEGVGCESSIPPEDLDPPAVFIASGVSGGSLGLVTYAASLVEGSEPTVREGWVQTRFDSDQLAPTASWALFADLPNALLRTDLLRDRAAVLEETWERGWPNWAGGPPTGLSLGLFQLRYRTDDQGRHLPLLLLNGTSVEDGCRFNTSLLDAAVEARPVGRSIEDCIALRPFEAGPSGVAATERQDWTLAATKDINEFLCGNAKESQQDVRLSTAALLSARFPYVSPAGRVVKCTEPGGQSATYVVDGGYFDTSGASAIVELWQALEPSVESFNLRSPDSCLVPVFVQLDNGYDNPRGPNPNARPAELMVPLQAAVAARNAHEANARQAGALAFAQRLFEDSNEPGKDSKQTWEDSEEPWDLDVGVRFRLDGSDDLDRYAHVYPRAHPGTRAPLGWALSKPAMDDLEKQLGGRSNSVEIERVHGWFKEDALSCQITDADPGGGR